MMCVKWIRSYGVTLLGQGILHLEGCNTEFLVYLEVSLKCMLILHLCCNECDHVTIFHIHIRASLHIRFVLIQHILFL